MEVTHHDIRSALLGADFPASGDELAEVARGNDAPAEVEAILERLGAADEYDSVEEVLDELNLDYTALEETTQMRAALGMEEPDPED